MAKASWVLTLLFALATTLSAQVTGTIKLDGEAPEAQEIDMSGVKECADQHADPVLEQSVVVGEQQGLANVIVAIQTDDPESLGGEAPSTTVVLDQHGCMYEPHVLSMTVGQPLVVKNSDPFLHNVHSLSEINPEFNFGQQTTDPGRSVGAMKAAERFRIKCDVHPWMSAYIGVFEHPFHAVSDANGRFEIPGKLPDGEYTVSLWHEKLGEQEQTIQVSGGKAELEATFSADGSASAAPAAVVPVLAASGDSCDAAHGCCETDGAAVAQSPATPQASAE